MGLTNAVPNARAIRDKVLAHYPQKSWLFVDHDGKAAVLLEGSEQQVVRARTQLASLVSIYGGKDAGMPSLADIEGDVLHHLKAARRVAA